MSYDLINSWIQNIDNKLIEKMSSSSDASSSTSGTPLIRGTINKRVSLFPNCKHRETCVNVKRLCCEPYSGRLFMRRNLRIIRRSKQWTPWQECGLPIRVVERLRHPYGYVWLAYFMAGRWIRRAKERRWDRSIDAHVRRYLDQPNDVDWVHVVSDDDESPSVPSTISLSNANAVSMNRYNIRYNSSNGRFEPHLM